MPDSANIPTSEAADEVASTGKCHWDCDNLDKSVSYRGWDVEAPHRICDKVFSELRAQGVELPVCALVYAEENSDVRFTDA